MKLDCVRCHKCGKVHSVEKGCNIDWDNPCKEIDKDKVITSPVKPRPLGRGYKVQKT